MVYLIPSLLDEYALATIPPYVLDAALDCQVFFVENERSARRYLKQLSKAIVIDDYQWVTIHKAEGEVRDQFVKFLKEGKNIGIISEAGCPGVADPGQILAGIAHEQGVQVKPLVGPSSILLALMASGMNGQQFRFVGYLPIDNTARLKALREMEADSLKHHSTQIFIETPYRNNQLLEAITKNCRPQTWLCIAADITGENEYIRTQRVSEWKKNIPELHKRPVIFCLLAE